MSQKTTITISTGSVHRAVDARSLFEHLAQALKEHDIKSAATITVESDGTVYLERWKIFTPQAKIAVTSSRAGR